MVRPAHGAGASCAPSGLCDNGEGRADSIGFPSLTRAADGDLPALGEPAGRAGVRLHDVDRARREHVAEAEAGELAFAAGNRNRERGLDLAVACEIFRRHRLLEPADVERRDGAAELDRRRGIIGVIGVDHDGDAVADALAYRLAELDVVGDARQH